MANRLFRLLAAPAFAAFSAFATAGASFSLPATVAEYSPFALVIDSPDAPLCDGASTYVAGTVRLAGNTVDISIPPTGARCAARTMTVPGLPRTVRSVRVTLTESVPDATSGSTRTTASLVMTRDISVMPLFAVQDLPRFWTGELRASFSTTSPPAVLLTPSRTSMFVGQWQWLEPGDPQTEAYTFKALSAPLTAGALPAPLARLYRVEYPAPFAGAYFTIDGDAARRLAREWSRNAEELPYALGRTDALGCPIGMSPVYRLFNPAAVFHRWTQSAETYRVLMAGGFVGEGIAWCAPNREG